MQALRIGLTSTVKNLRLKWAKPQPKQKANSALKLKPYEQTNEP